MRGFLVMLGLMLPLGAQAEAAMEQAQCRDGWQVANAATGQAKRFLIIEPIVNAEGWCQIDESVAELREDDFSKLVWRAMGVEAAIEKGGFPESFEAQFTGIDLIEGFNLPLPPEWAGAAAQLYVKAERDFESRGFAVEAVAFDFGELGQAKMRFAGGGIDLSSAKQMQFTVGGLRFHEAALSLTTTPDLSRALHEGMTTEAQMAQLQEIVAVLPKRSVSAESRAGLEAFLTAGPDQAGKLEIVATSETGLGILQVVGGTMQLDRGVSGADGMSAAVEQILTGVRIEASLMPDNSACFNEQPEFLGERHGVRVSGCRSSFRSGAAPEEP